MPQGSKESYTDKQKRKAQHIEDGYLEKGAPRKKAERIAWATVNKEDGGAEKKKRKTAGSSAKKSTRTSAKSTRNQH